jgi:hypothetical protein
MFSFRNRPTTRHRYERDRGVHLLSALNQYSDRDQSGTPNSLTAMYHYVLAFIQLRRELPNQFLRVLCGDGNAAVSNGLRVEGYSGALTIFLLPFQIEFLHFIRH